MGEIPHPSPTHRDGAHGRPMACTARQYSHHARTPREREGMITTPLTTLIVGATGSIGRLVVAESHAHGHTTLSGLPYTIVRPGWFDMNGPDEHRPVFLQGDTRLAGTPADGAIARQEIAQVLVEALTAPQATRRTFELVAENGPAPEDLRPLFEALAQDAPSEGEALTQPSRPWRAPASVEEILQWRGVHHFVWPSRRKRPYQGRRRRPPGLRSRSPSSRRRPTRPLVMVVNLTASRSSR
ncbi:NAD(P)H-binding protein [Streptomyces sp. NPDC054783]